MLSKKDQKIAWSLLKENPYRLLFPETMAQMLLVEHQSRYQGIKCPKCGRPSSKEAIDNLGECLSCDHLLSDNPLRELEF
jgi:hypothetical protein